MTTYIVYFCLMMWIPVSNNYDSRDLSHKICTQIRECDSIKANQKNIEFVLKYLEKQNARVIKIDTIKYERERKKLD